jgi:hypothetical protein
MGLEYRHEIVVSDPGWMPDAGTLPRVLEVLARYGVCNPAAGQIQPILGSAPDTARVFMEGDDPGVGVLWDVDDPEGGGLELVLGDGAEPLTIAVVVGSDIRIPSFSEGCFYEVVGPAKRGAEEVRPRETKKGVNAWLFYDSFPGTAGITPPGLKWHNLDESEAYKPVNVPGQAPRPFPGFWRGGVLLDFDQRFPDFEAEDRRIPNAAFMRDLAAAFRAPLAERGYCD